MISPSRFSRLTLLFLVLVVAASCSDSTSPLVADDGDGTMMSYDGDAQVEQHMQATPASLYREAPCQADDEGREQAPRQAQQARMIASRSASVTDKTG